MLSDVEKQGTELVSSENRKSEEGSDVLWSSDLSGSLQQQDMRVIWTDAVQGHRARKKSEDPSVLVQS